jgi:DNA polymerase-1
VGISVSALGSDEDHYFAWGHPEGNNCSLDDVRDWFDELKRSNPKVTFALHNAGYDMRMCRYVGVNLADVRTEDTGTLAAMYNNLEPSLSLNELSKKYLGREKQDKELNEWCANAFGGKPTREAQAKNYHRAPGHIVAPYAKGDSRDTVDLYAKLYPLMVAEGLQRLFDVECQLHPILLQMHMVGVRVAREKAQGIRDEFLREYDRVLDDWTAITGGSNFNGPQLPAMLAKMGHEVWRTEAGNLSAPKELLEKLASQDVKIARMALDLRRLKHYAGTFIDNYILSNVRDGDLVHGEFHPVRNERYGTVSGRFSSGGSLNLQNIPARDDVYAPMIRGLYVPYYDGQEWVKFDYSQIEYRFLAHYAGGGIMEAYCRDPEQDFHQMVADLTGLDRKPAKTLNFALVYGQGDKATAAQLRITLEEAQRFIREYNARAPEIRELYDEAMRLAGARGYIDTWGGRRSRFELRRDGRGYDRTNKALNALLQGSAADLIKFAMIRVASIIDWEDCIMHLTVHDELDFSMTPGDVGDGYRRQIKQAMEDVELRVPVLADCDVGPDWGHVQEWVDPIKSKLTA